MSIIGSSWKDEPSDEEKYKDITGHDYQGDNLRKDIESRLDDNWTGKEERKQLMDLLSQINKNNE